MKIAWAKFVYRLSKVFTKWGRALREYSSNL